MNISINNFILYLILLCALGACVPIGPACIISTVANNNAGDVDYTKCPDTTTIRVKKISMFSVNANGNYDNKENGQWYNTGISVLASDDIAIMTRGAIATCASWGESTPIQITLSNSTAIPIRAGDAHACDTINIWVNDPCPNVIGNNRCNNCNYSATATANCNAVSYSSSPSRFAPSTNVNNTYNYPTCASDTSAYLRIPGSGTDTSSTCWHGFGYGLSLGINNTQQSLIAYINNTTNQAVNTNGSTYYSIKIPYQSPYKVNLSLALNNAAVIVGGYNVHLQNTAPCQSFDGIGINDGNLIEELGYTGALQAIVVPNSDNPNTYSKEQKKSARLLTEINNDVTSTSARNICPTPHDSNNFELIDPNYGKQSAKEDGTIWLKIADNDKSFQENTGRYTVYIEHYVEQASSMTNGVTDLINNVKNGITNVGENVFKNITASNTSLSTIIYATLSLYIVFIGVQFVLGLTQMNQMELVTHLVKIGVVMALISPGSWTFFNTYLFDAFINGSTDLIIMATGNECGNQKNPLNFLDKILNFLFEPATFIKIIALLFSSPFGVLYIYMLLNGIYRLFEAILNALFVYFAAFFYIALLISLAPIFITFILFEFTNSFFENWLRNLFRACFEPVLLIVGLAILANVLVIVINNIFDFAACFKCMLPIFIDIGDGKTLPLFCIYGFTPAGYDNSGSGIMPTIFYQFNQIMLFYIITHIMKSYADVAMQISETIFSSRAVGAARTGAAASGSFNQGMLSLIGRDKKTLAKQSNIKALGAAYEESGKETKPLEELKDADDKFKKDQSPTDKDSSDKPESNK